MIDVVDGPDPVQYRFGPVKLQISRRGYGWTIHLGKRVGWSSRRATTPMWPRLVCGADENCNRAVTAVVWPLGSLDVWWEPTWRTEPCGCDERSDPCRQGRQSATGRRPPVPEGQYYEIVILFRRDEIELDPLLERLEAAICQHEEPRDDCPFWTMAGRAIEEAEGLIALDDADLAVDE